MFKFLSKKDTLLLAVISAASYSAAYLYEFSYAKYFNYPKELISISLVNLLRMGFSFFMLMLFSIFIIDFCTKATDALGKYGSNVRKAYAPITMGIILLIFLYLAGISIFKYYLIGMAIFIAFLILSTFFEKKKTKNNDKNQSDNKKPKGNGDLSATTKILSFFMLLFFSYGFILALGT
ncbi:hypothetical protein GHV28_06555 [Proteus mirabilis]|nr:hypothetical protein [Proteus mirabilis]